MEFVKYNKSLTKVKLTASEKRAMDEEINKEIAALNRKNEREIDAVVLWSLHQILGLGPDRLRKVYSGFHKEFNRLNERYEMGESGNPYICTQALKEYGINLEELEEMENE